jgi:hypothetical protein
MGDVHEAKWTQVYGGKVKLEYFGKGSNGEFFAPVLRASAELVVPTISINEVYKRIVVQRDEEEALSADLPDVKYVEKK